VVVIAAVLSVALHKLGLLERLELVNLDILLLAKQPVANTEVLLVTVEQSDYVDIFHSRSPLDQGQVIDIINRIASVKPKVIGVDLDTSDWDPQLRQRLAPNGVPIVWARDVAEEMRSDQRTSQSDSSKAEMGKVFGDDKPQECWGVPAIAPDNDGIVRNYDEGVQVPAPNPENKQHGPRDYAPSFVTVVSRAADNRYCSALEFTQKPTPERKRINFENWRLNRYSASAILNLSRLPAWKASPDQFPEIHDKVVLLGGAFRQARDRYRTPISWMDGVEILGQAVVSEKHGGISEAGLLKMMGIDVLVGMALLSLNYLLKLRIPQSARHRMLALKFVLLMVLLLVATFVSWASFTFKRYYVSSLIVAAGLFVDELLKHAVEYRELVGKNRKLFRENSVLADDNRHLADQNRDLLVKNAELLPKLSKPT